MVFNKHASQVARADIDWLLSEGTPEGQRLEYKEQLPSRGDGASEFCRHVAGLANSTGGWMIFGLKEKRDSTGKPTGVPESVAGLQGVNVDQECLRLANIIRDSISPRLIPHPVVVAVPGFESTPVIVAYVPASLTRPHMFGDRFYARQGAQTVPLRVEQVRAAFLESDAIPQRIRTFRAERLASILGGETPLPLMRPASFVLHLCPMESFGTDARIDVRRVQDALVQPPGFHGGFNYRYNLDGTVSYTVDSMGKAHKYVQYFRSGAIEFATVELVDESARGADRVKIIRIKDIAIILVTKVPDLIRAVKPDIIGYPLVVMVSLLGTRGACAIFDQYAMESSRPMHEDQLLLPPVVLEEEPSDWGDALRGTLDTIWQCVGVARCPHYTDGKFMIPGYR